MVVILDLNDIMSLVDEIDVIAAMRHAFVAYSKGHAIVPPVGELIFTDPPGDVHIKYGYIRHQDYYVVKIASGFYNNPQIGVASGQGLMLLFKQATGELATILLDDGYLTNLRTVGAAALAVDTFASRKGADVGIIGTGAIAKMQIEILQRLELGARFWLWGRSDKKAKELKDALGDAYNIRIAATCAEVVSQAEVIITTTPSESPLIQADEVKEGTLIIAIGSDTEHKQELAGELLKKADLVIADSIAQSNSRGEVYQAVKSGRIDESKAVEFGVALQDTDQYKLGASQITIIDLTGVAVQDIMIATAVLENYKNTE